ncbi:hypothetical protein Aca07nite_45590 [Actinoplanes capillaceus]|uniref:Uncharacterized protein n=1 Tax=Actinoplanes campanulatus TaxID=113559 RepID=A0ABQ3WLZ9_9ACTN|nr:hypothetical protein [Actinoplanes capillaceus]GID47284.1 hypothetical protein Aca07nite_45590 [Actinoplanes capillaceus]
MKPLSELLQEAKVDAPPPRYDVDHVVAAGRRRVRRRNSGWALAAVVAVATAIGVPQIATRDSAPSLGQAPAASATPDNIYPGTDLFRGFAVDGYRVEDPTGGGPNESSSDVIDINTGKSVAGFNYYAPGADVKEIYGSGTWTEIDPIRGRPAYALDFEDELISLIWEYADDGYAMVDPGENSKITQAQMRTIAEGFVPGAGEVIKTVLRVGYVPDGYHVDGIGPYGATFRTGDVLAKRSGKLPSGMVIISLREPKPRWPPVTEATCEHDVCRKPVGEYELWVHGFGLPTAEFRKVFESVTLGVRDDPSTWTVARDAIPAHTLVQLK